MYALIENAKVTNIVSADKRGADSLIAAGMNLIQTDKPVAIGDDYTDGKFYRDGSEVLTPLEEALLVQADMQEALNILGGELMGYYTEKAKEVKAKQEAELAQLKAALQTIGVETEEKEVTEDA